MMDPELKRVNTQPLFCDRTSKTIDIAGARVDLGRAYRCGYPEVVFGEQKSTDLILRILHAQADAGQASLVTRITLETAAAIADVFPASVYSLAGKCLRTLSADASKKTAGRVAIVSAGSTDAFVANEAAETVRWMGHVADLFDDVGVAGPQRLLAVLPEIQTADAVVVVAGMEAALASVVAGYLSCPVFAVPTSVGYGVSVGGLVALAGMLASCAANVAVVNIDAGFKGGFLAGLVADRTRETHHG
jgi:hypothetical protein